MDNRSAELYRFGGGNLGSLLLVSMRNKCWSVERRIVQL